MAVRRIVLYEKNPEALRSRCKTVPVVDGPTRRLIRDLEDTLIHTSDGIGLAAPQINVHSRVITVRLGGGRPDCKPGPPLTIINPHVLEAGDAERDNDGCLSFPGFYGETVRPHFLRVAGHGEKGNSFERTFEGFDAVVVHHEIDHLDGILFIDRLEKLEDLYTVVEDDRGELVRHAISEPLPFLLLGGNGSVDSREAYVGVEQRRPATSARGEARSRTREEAKC